MGSQLHLLLLASLLDKIYGKSCFNKQKTQFGSLKYFAQYDMMDTPNPNTGAQIFEALVRMKKVTDYNSSGAFFYSSYFTFPISSYTRDNYLICILFSLYKSTLFWLAFIMLYIFFFSEKAHKHTKNDGSTVIVSNVFQNNLMFQSKSFNFHVTHR